tara:strand:- start:341 stop:670 length:330 start_codon:yes stop_codon:yes gene_type:complete
MKLKPILPSLREKKRYVAFEVQGQVTKATIEKEIISTMKEFIGTLGMANAGLEFLPDWENNRGIYRINTKYTDHSKASLALIKKFTVKSLGTSGIINKIRKKYFLKEGN